jgi:hypothetical protein
MRGIKMQFHVQATVSISIRCETTAKLILWIHNSILLQQSRRKATELNPTPPLPGRNLTPSLLLHFLALIGYREKIFVSIHQARLQ